MAKTNTSKTKKPATAVRRKPTQLDRIEKMLDNVWGVMEKNTIGLKDVGQRLRTIDVETTRHLVAIQADLSLLKSGASFMQELYRATQQEEQGLEDGDYTDASKEVADALTAMGYEWVDADRFNLSYITWHSEPSSDLYGLVVCSPGRQDNKLTKADFLSRARVTAKKLGLVPREEPKEEWMVGDWFWNAGRDWKEPQRVDAVKGEQVFTEFEGDLYGYFKSNIVKASLSEVAEHEAKIKAKEEEQKLARLTFGTRVHAKEKEGDIEREYYVLGPTGPIKGGLYHLWHEGMECVHTIYIDRITIID